MAALAAVLPVAAGSPVMTTRYQPVRIARLEAPVPEPYRFELTDGALVDVRVSRIDHATVSGIYPSGHPASINLGTIRRAGVPFQEKDQAATNIKYGLVGTGAYVGMLLIVLLVAGAMEGRQ